MKKRIFLPLLMSALVIFGCSKDDTSELMETNVEKGTATIAAGTYQQTIHGFGGASIRGWIPDLTTAQANKAFDPVSGMGLSVLRVRVPHRSTDFAAEKATIDRAKSHGATVIASAWTAPANMKDNNNLIGGKLKTTSYNEYAAHLRNFVNAVGGVSAISPINEPNIDVSYESMKMTAAEVANFVAAQGNNCGAPIMAPEPYNMDANYINSYMGNSTARSRTAYVCGHIYGKASNPPKINGQGKPVWMTEHITDTNNANNWGGAMNTATEIHRCMNAGYSMWAHWYIRRSYGLLDENGNVTKRGYVVTHFSKYIRPGYRKVSCTANPTSGVLTTAYRNGSRLVVVAINQNNKDTYQPFTINGLTVSGFNRFRTTSSSNLASDGFSISGGNFGIMLPASSITTLVSR